MIVKVPADCDIVLEAYRTAANNDTDPIVELSKYFDGHIPIGIHAGIFFKIENEAEAVYFKLKYDVEPHPSKKK